MSDTRLHAKHTVTASLKRVKHCEPQRNTARIKTQTKVNSINPGLLLGILGFLLVYVLNESKRIDFHMHPGFVALFAFMFAVSAGTFWEIFEFGMDQSFGTNMQKPMPGDASGLTDTMWDLIIDAVGAAIISCFGWWNMKQKSRSFLDHWIGEFIERNPRMFRGLSNDRQS